MLGTCVGNYQVVSQLGMGGMGAVYLAHHSMLGRPAAVKVLLPEMSQNRDIVTRFFNEARAATAIRHPSIVEIYDFGFLPLGNAYIIMELLEGESLAKRVERLGYLPVESALLLVRQIAGALHAAHSRQIVHRDLKPDNVFVVRDPEIVGGERIKLLDFGIAKLASDTGDNKTRTGTVMGTPSYMSPEQCRGAGTIDHRTDLYALGCMFYELLCGRPPFTAEGAGEIIAHHLYFQPESPRHYLPSLPEELEPLVLWLLQKDPAARPASAAEVIAAIDQLGLGAPRSSAKLPVPPEPGLIPELARGLLRATAATAATALGKVGTTGKPTTLGGAASVHSPPTMMVRRRARFGLSAAVGGALIAGGLGWMWQGEGGDGGAVREKTSVAIEVAAAPQVPAVPAVPEVPDALTWVSAAGVVALLPAPSESPSASKSPDGVGLALSAQMAAAPVELTHTLESQPAGADVWRAGQLLGSTPLLVKLPRGEAARSYAIRRAGFVEVEVTMAADSDDTERVVLRRKPAVRSPARATRPAAPPAKPAPPAASKPAKPASSGSVSDGVNPFD